MAQSCNMHEDEPMEALNIVVLFFGSIAGCILIDWHMRGLSARKARLRMQAEVQSYLQPRKRL
jgi:hypothetical protein